MSLWFQQNIRWVAILSGFLLLSLLPFEMSSSFHDSQRLISSVFVTIMLGFGIRSVMLARMSLWLLGGLYIYSLVAIIFSPILVWSLVEFSLLFSFMLLALVLVEEVEQKTMNLLVIFFVIVQSFYLTRNLTNYVFVMQTGISFDAFALIDGFSNVRFYGQFLLWTVPFVLGVMAARDKFPYRNVILLIVSLNWAFEFLTGTRAFVLGMSVSIVAAIWVAKAYWKRYLQYWLLTAIVGFGVYYLLAFAIPDVMQQTENLEAAVQQSAGRELTANGNRMELWGDALQLALEHPVLGAGPMTTAISDVSRVAAHPHNYLLQFMAEWGLAFTLLLMGFGLYAMVRWQMLVMQGDSIQRQALALPVAAACGAVMASGLVDGFIVMPVSLTYMGLILALAVALWRQWTPDRRREPLPRWFVPILLVPPLFLMMFSLLSWSGGLGDDSVLTGFHTVNIGFPRFWSRGSIIVEGFEE